MAIKRFYIPTLPKEGLSPNARKHWSAKARAAKQLRIEVSVSVLGVVRQEGWQDLPFSKARLEIEVRVCRKKLGADGFYRPRDEDNAQASLKSAIDGLVDAGVVVDDTAKQLQIIQTTLVEVPTRSEEAIILSIESST